MRGSKLVDFVDVKTLPTLVTVDRILQVVTAIPPLERCDDTSIHRLNHGGRTWWKQLDLDVS